jgi:hypothetical protein
MDCGVHRRKHIAWRWGTMGWLVLACAAAANGAPSLPPTHMNGPLEYAMSDSHIIARTVDLLHDAAIQAAAEPHVPAFASISLDQDEYIYSLPDKHFIRVIKKRHEIPAWRHCGDWAQVRVERYDENMDSIDRPELWVFIYRDTQWQRIELGAGGMFLNANRQAHHMPPYAVRCFNLDRKERSDPLE